MNSRGIQDLPQEIFHIILDYLGNNKSILRSCSLVCRSWLQASRPRLFAIVSLYACEQRLVGFLDFLGTHPDITNHVRSLMLHKPMDEQPPGVDGSLEASVTPSTLARTARALPRLRECQLYFVHVVHSTRRPDPAAAHSAPPIDLGVLHIFGSAHQEIGPFLEMLSHFRLDRLELELVSFDPCPVLPPGTLDVRIHVRDLWADLETVDDSPVAILSALAPALTPGVLQTFHCNWREWSGCAPVGAFLRTVGHSLADLELNMAVPSWVEDKGSAILAEDWDALCLSACARVRTFRTSMPLPMACTLSDVAEMRRCVTSYRDLLSRVPASAHTVVVYMSAVSTLPRGSTAPLPGTQGRIPVDFHEIEEVLLEMPSLRKLVIATRAAQNAKHGAAAVAKAFPALHARGVLEVRSGSVLSVSSW